MVSCCPDRSGQHHLPRKLNGQNMKVLYLDAIDALIKIQLASGPNELPPYDRALLQREMNLFEGWYV